MSQNETNIALNPEAASTPGGNMPQTFYLDPDTLKSAIREFWTLESQKNQNTIIDPNEIKNHITKTVQEEIQKALREGTTTKIIETDEGEEEMEMQASVSSAEMDRMLNSLREFSGVQKEYGSWRKSVERMLNMGKHWRGTPKYYGILNIIRNKITGDADTALESYNTPLNWEKIVDCLNMHYADKRDINTLDSQMVNMTQKGNSVQDFYQQVYGQLSLILNHVASMNLGREAKDALTNTYRERALDAFISGLKGDMPRLLSVREPVDLPHALYLCQKLTKLDYKNENNHQGNKRKFEGTYRKTLLRVHR